jgi:hypothetical protein
MRRVRPLPALACGLALAACGSAAAPPRELSGLWSAGPAACEAGVGVRFGGDSIAAVYDDERQTLFKHPHYTVESDSDEQFQVRISYELPHRAGGARSTGAEGILVLERSADGGIEVASHNLLDARTGTARVRIVNDPAVNVLRLQPCGDHAWRMALRGRREP